MEPMEIVNFKTLQGMTGWYIINDGVMGGLSKSVLDHNPQGFATFKGLVLLENNGGFCSIRCDALSISRKGYSKALIHLKGDGKSYQFRIKQDRWDAYSYIYSFQTSGDWETVEIPLSEMHPTFRGRKLSIPNFKGAIIDSMGFLIGNKKREYFELQISHILLVP